MADRLGTQVGNYRLTHLLGKGGFAEVYLGEHIHLGTQAAIKLLHAPLASTGEIEKFRQEARIIATLQHPHVLRVLEFGIEADQPYLVLEHAPGGSLRERHPSGTTVPLATIVSYVQQIAQALQYAHDQKLIHRDIKPQNLLMGRNGEILLSDFGISVVAESTSRQQAQGFAGTVAYSAPEQLQEHPRPASDQYALAIVIYEWLSGHLPFTGALGEVAAKHLFAAPPSLGTQLPTLPPAVEGVVFTALAKDPKDRFATVQAFARALMQASQTATTQPFVPTSTTPIVPPPQVAPTPEIVDEATPPASSTSVLPSVAQAAPAPVSASSLQPTAERALAASSASPVTPAPAGGPTEQAGHPPTSPALLPTFTQGIFAPESDRVGTNGPAAASVRKRFGGRTLLIAFMVLILVGSGLGALGVVGKSLLGRGFTPTATPRPGVVTEFSLDPNSDPLAITAEPDGDLWFTEFKGIGRITPSGDITEYSVPHPTPNTGPEGITLGPDRNLWFTDLDRIGRITPTGDITTFPAPLGSDSALQSLTTGPDGNLWFIGQTFDSNGAATSGKLGLMSPEGEILRLYILPYAPNAITTGPDGNLWFTQNYGNQIGRFTPTGTLTEFPVPTKQGQPWEITSGPDGNLWFTELAGNQIGRISPAGKITEFPVPTNQSKPRGIISGPDGNLWFTEQASNQIGRITPGGIISEFPLPLPNGDVTSITVGSDRNVWFTQFESSQIGRMTTGR